MKITDQIYEIKSKRLLSIVDHLTKEKQRCHRAWSKFAKTVGAEKNYWVNGFGGEQWVCGFSFKKTPDPSLWKKSYNGEYWVPSKRTKQGRLLYDQFKTLPRFESKELAAAVNWKDIFVPGHLYAFSWFYYPKKNFAGIKVPVFDTDTYKNMPEAKYRPVKGLKEITANTFARKSV